MWKEVHVEGNAIEEGETRLSNPTNQPQGCKDLSTVIINASDFLSLLQSNDTQTMRDNLRTPAHEVLYLTPRTRKSLQPKGCLNRQELYRYRGWEWKLSSCLSTLKIGA